VAVVGIDLGTTNTVVGVVQGGEACTVRTPAGQHLIPSVVSFHENGNVLVGQVAKERRVVDAANTIYSIKRLIGRSWNSEEVGRARARFPFEMREGPGQAALVVARNETFTLPEISAFVLRHAKAVAEQALGEPVDRAVITVPANFNDLQRAATKVAGRVAGLEVLRILNEPTAAALAYGYGKGKGERIVIYDFGGGTFDVTLLDLSGNVFEVLATAGNTFLGGDDIDLAIAERMADACSAQYDVDARTDSQIFERLRYYAERLKVDLSTAEDASIVVPDVGRGANGQSLRLDFRMSRTELEELASPIVERSFEVCADALNIARLTPAELDQVVLVGGSTRLPIVRARVAEFFERTPLDRINPDEVVAIGAAIQATALTYAERRRSIIPKPPMPAARSLEGSVPGARTRPKRPSGLPGTTRSDLDVDPDALRKERRPLRQGILVPSPRTSRPPPLPSRKPGGTRPAPFGSERAAIKKRGGTLGGIGNPISDSSSPSAAPEERTSDFGLDRPSSLFPPHTPQPEDSEPTQVRPAPRGLLDFEGANARSAPPTKNDEPTLADASFQGIEAALARELPGEESADESIDDSLFEELPVIDLEEELDQRPSTPGKAPPLPRRGTQTAPGVGTLPRSTGARTTGTGKPAALPPAEVRPPAPPLESDPLLELDLPPLIDTRPRTESGRRASRNAPSFTDFGQVRVSATTDPLVRGTLAQTFVPSVPEAHTLSSPRMESQAPLPLLVDVTPLSLCVETVSGYRDVVVDRNTPVPCEQSRTFVTARDGQDSVRLRVGQGESAQFAGNTVLGELELLGLRPAPRGEVRVVVTFALDTSGMLGVRAVDEETGNVATAELRLVGLPDAAEVGRMTTRGQARQTR
jgi:molecular chaperone DnaK